MQSEPKGPVYLMLPREILTEVWADEDMRSFPGERFGSTQVGGADPQLVERLADALLAAKNPILITSYGGRNAAARRTPSSGSPSSPASRVFEANMVNNISHEGAVLRRLRGRPGMSRRRISDCWSTSTCRGFRATRKAERQDLLGADRRRRASRAARRCGASRAICACRATARRILEQLLEVLRAESHAGFREAAAGARRRHWRREQSKRMQTSAELAAESGQARRDQFALSVRGARASASTPRTSSSARRPAIRRRCCSRSRVRCPNTLMRVGGGGLGSSGGMALGAKLARPTASRSRSSATAASISTSPSSVFAVSKQYKLPILTIVLDNGGWSAVKESTLRVYPDGDAKVAERVRGRAARGRGFLQGRRGVRRLWREADRSGARCRRRSSAASRRSAAAVPRCCMPA